MCRQVGGQEGSHSVAQSLIQSDSQRICMGPGKPRKFPEVESPGKRLLVLESAGDLLNSSKKYEKLMYGRQ